MADPIHSELGQQDAECFRSELEQTGDDLRAARKLLALCIEWLPHGPLYDTVRQVSEGRSAAEAWRALRDMEMVDG